MPKRVREEIQNSRTPAHVQEAALPKLFTIPVGLNSDEQRRKRIIEQELQGDARPGKHMADADHLFEAAKYGGYFITYDQRILTRAGRLREVLPPSLTVVTLVDFLAIFDDYAARDGKQLSSSINPHSGTVLIMVAGCALPILLIFPIFPVAGKTQPKPTFWLTGRTMTIAKD